MAALGGGYRATVVASAQDLARLTVRQPFKLNKVALMYIRARNENPPGHPITNGVDLTRSDPYQIGVTEKIIGTKTAGQRWYGLPVQRRPDTAMVMAANVGSYECASQGVGVGFQSDFRRRPHYVRAGSWKL